MPEHIKTITLPTGVAGVDLSKLLVELGACSSRSQAKRLIKQGVVSIDKVVTTNSVVTLPPTDPVIKCGRGFYRKLVMPRKTFTVLVDNENKEARILAQPSHGISEELSTEYILRAIETLDNAPVPEDKEWLENLVKQVGAAKREEEN